MKATFYYYSNGGINVILESVTGREERRFVFYTLQEVKNTLRSEGVRGVTHMKKIDLPGRKEKWSFPTDQRADF